MSRNYTTEKEKSQGEKRFLHIDLGKNILNGEKLEIFSSLIWF